MLIKSYFSHGDYVVIDTDFEETVPKKETARSGWETLIKVYEKKNLNVAPNLMRAIVLYAKENNGNGVLDIIDVICKNSYNDNPSFFKYKEELERYLMLA